jgi:MoaA/NifB/PqqE/SkfB family radical SAM enzyme
MPNTDVMDTNNTIATQGCNNSFPSFLPQLEFDKYSVNDLHTLIGDRKVYLRGAAFVGQGTASGLKRNGIEIEAYLDSSPRLMGKKLHGKPVYDPNQFLSNVENIDNIFIIMCTGFWRNEFVEEFNKYNLIEGVHYISSFDLVPICPNVDVSGICNLRCIGCPRGNMREHPPAGFMAPETYVLVIDKLLRELPFLGQVQLYAWGEPLLNKHIYDIIAINKERTITSIISSNLNLPIDMDKLVKSAPEVFRVSCSGWGENYEITHTGAKWELFYNNLHKLCDLNNKYGSDIAIELFYHRYQHNPSDFDKVKELCDKLNIAFRPIVASLLPRENHIKLRLKEEMTPEANKQLGLLTPSAMKLLDRDITTDPDIICLESRSFAINWNLNVRVCGAYYIAKVLDNFLEVPTKEIVHIIANSKICAYCAKVNVHGCGKADLTESRDSFESLQS